MFPSRLLVAFVFLPSVLSVATIFVEGLLWPLLGVDVAIVLIALVDLIITRSAGIEATVVGRDILSIGQNNQVELGLTLKRRNRLSVRIRPSLPLELHCAELSDGSSLHGGDTPFLRAQLQKRVTVTLRYHLVPQKRGQYELGDHVVRYRSRLGLWIKQESLPTARTVRVYPDLAMIRTYELLARQHRQYALVRASRLRGGESEFARLRDYSSDDDYRFIDWKATARRNQLTTREFQLESDQNIFMILDAGRLMTGLVSGLSQFDLALNSALLMAHVASSGGDRVGLMCFDEDVRAFLQPQGGPHATGRLVRATYSMHPQLTESSFQKAFGAFEQRVKKRSMLMIFTQLLDDTAVEELSTQLRLLSRKHLALVVVLEDTELLDVAAGPHDSPESLQELYDRGAAAELLRWKAEAVTRLKSSGALVIQTPASELNNKVINRYLSIKAQHAL